MASPKIPSAQNSNALFARCLAAALVPVVIALGLACKLYSGPAATFVNNFGPASVAYEWLWMLLAFIVWPERKWIVRIAVVVFVATCLIEFLQLWKHGTLETVRATFLGKMVLGNSFSWWDFPAYLVGCLSGYWILAACCSFKTTSRDQKS